MLGTRHEEYGSLTDGLPFVLNTDIKRTFSNYSKETNWHDEVELQLCLEGSGTVLLDGKRYPFGKDDIAAVGSNVIHYTGTDAELTYACIIISSDFCRKMGLNLTDSEYIPPVQDAYLANLFRELIEIYSDKHASCRTAKLNRLLLGILITLTERYSAPKRTASEDGDLEKIKAAILYLRENYDGKVTLDEVSRAVLYDKYALCRKFKAMTGQTIMQYVNNYRCLKAVDCLNSGHTVAQTALLCGFENLSFFTKTFKRYIGKLPSSCK